MTRLSFYFKRSMARSQLVVPHNSKTIDIMQLARQVSIARQGTTNNRLVAKFGSSGKTLMSACSRRVIWITVENSISSSSQSTSSLDPSFRPSNQPLIVLILTKLKLSQQRRSQLISRCLGSDSTSSKRRMKSS